MNAHKDPSETPTILMVDDEPTTLEVMEMFLRGAGYEQVIRTSDSREVVALMEEKRPDLLLLNLMMPHMDGVEVLKAVRGHEDLSDVPILIVTGSSDPAIKQRAVDHGATDFLGKPIDPSELALRVRNTLTASGRAFAQPAPRPEAARRLLPKRRPVAAPGTPLVSRLTGDDARSRAIVEAFVGRLRDKLVAMEESIALRDFNELVNLAHWLKGAAGTVGFDEFTEPAQALQYLARERKLEPLESAIEELWGLADRIIVGAEAAD
jgi:CheY-like chemotaxis protein